VSWCCRIVLCGVTIGVSATAGAQLHVLVQADSACTKLEGRHVCLGVPDWDW
jgi:hypothetical protein